MDTPMPDDRGDEFYDRLNRGAHDLAAAVDAAAVLSAISHHLGRAVTALDPAHLDLDGFRAAIGAVEAASRSYVDGTATPCTR